jgi:hypothetical protein
MRERPVGQDVEPPGETRGPDGSAPLLPRDTRTRVGRFHRGAHSPFAIRWFGMTALVGHLRHLVAVAAASQQLDLRDWMRPESGTQLLDRVRRVALSASVRARTVRPATTWGIAVLFGVVLSLLLLGCYRTLGSILPGVSLVPAVVAYAFLASFVLGLFLLVLALMGLEHHQGFAVLGHPGFRHFVRLCVHPSGRVEGFVIGKDDPLGNGPPVLVDRFVWDSPRASAGRGGQKAPQGTAGHHPEHVYDEDEHRDRERDRS